MARFDTKFKSNKQDWETPIELFEIINRRYNIDFDLAANKSNTKCSEFFSKEDDALTKSWRGRCWLNPPYGGKMDNALSEWIKKSFNESLHEDCMVVMLVPARTNTNWWHDYCMKANEILFIRGRPKFVGAKYGLPQPLAVVIFDCSNDIQLMVGSLDCR